MKANLRTLGMIALGTSVLGACATKGFVRTAVRDERAARIAGDSANARDINGVRSDVATLRTIGYGKERLVNPGAEKDQPGAEANRRVVFVIETRGANTVAILPGDAPQQVPQQR